MLKFNLLCLLAVLVCACGESDRRSRQKRAQRLDALEDDRPPPSQNQSSSSGNSSSSSSSNCHDRAFFEFDNGFSFNPNASLRLSTSMNVAVEGGSGNTGYVYDAGYKGSCVAGTYSFTFEHDGKHHGLEKVRRIFRGTFYIDGKSDKYEIDLDNDFSPFELEDRSFTIVVRDGGREVSRSTGSYSAYKK